MFQVGIGRRYSGVETGGPEGGIADALSQRLQILCYKNISISLLVEQQH